MINIVLYQPDIPQNAGAFVRLTACLELNLHIIEPCGFILDDKKLKRVAMDYAQNIAITRHASFQAFMEFIKQEEARVILLTNKTKKSYLDVTYQNNDFLLLGRESSGVPDEVVRACNDAVTIPMAVGARSLNVVNAASMVAGEALRQTRRNKP